MNTDPWGQNGLTQAAVIAGVFACWASAVKMNLTNATHVVLGDVPTPSSYGVPFLYGDSHSARLTLLFEKNGDLSTRLVWPMSADICEVVASWYFASKRVALTNEARALPIIH